MRDLLIVWCLFVGFIACCLVLFSGFVYCNLVCLGLVIDWLTAGFVGLTLGLGFGLMLVLLTALTVLLLVVLRLICGFSLLFIACLVGLLVD